MRTSENPMHANFLELRVYELRELVFYAVGKLQLAPRCAHADNVGRKRVLNGEVGERRVLMSNSNEAEFTTEEVMSQAQGNATAFALASIAYAKEHDLAVEEYVAFVGQKFAPGWEELRGQSLREVARMAALNWVSVGGGLSSLSGDDERAEVVIAGWPREEELSELGITQADSEPLWNIFEPIMEYLGIRYSWQRQDGEVRMIFERENAE